LYLRSGWSADAEQLLREAVDLSEDATVHLLSLHQLLLAQGRTQEADYYAQLLKSRRDKDPYYWIGLGLKNLREGEFRQAVNALEKAQALTNGFEDVHRYLAVAYWRAGQSSRANEQLEMLASLHPGSDDVVTLRKKFNSAVH
jgi:Tfp pilus assembly protein PilF